MRINEYNIRDFICFLWKIRFFIEKIFKIKYDISVIPKNTHYCYTPINFSTEGKYKIKSCPYYKSLGGMYSICKYTRFADWNMTHWDQCKICNIE